MRKWTGEPGNASLPADVEKALMRRSRHVLERHGVPDEAIAKLVQRLGSTRCRGLTPNANISSKQMARATRCLGLLTS